MKKYLRLITTLLAFTFVSCAEKKLDSVTATSSEDGEAKSKEKKSRKKIGNTKKKVSSKKQTIANKKRVSSLEKETAENPFSGCGFSHYDDASFKYSQKFTSETTSISGTKSSVDYVMDFRSQIRVTTSEKSGISMALAHEIVSVAPRVAEDEFQAALIDASTSRKGNLVTPNDAPEVYYAEDGSPLCALIFSSETESKGKNSFVLTTDTPAPNSVNFQMSSARFLMELGEEKVFEYDVTVEESAVSGLDAGETFPGKTIVTSVNPEVTVKGVDVIADYAVRFQNIYDHGPVNLSDGEENFELQSLDTDITYYVFEEEIIAIEVASDGNDQLSEIKFLSNGV